MKLRSWKSFFYYYMPTAKITTADYDTQYAIENTTVLNDSDSQFPIEATAVLNDSDGLYAIQAEQEATN